jgi:hypothetical protein
MKVLIAKANQDIVKEILEVCVNDVRKIKFTEASKNTCTFSVNGNELKDLIEETKGRGYNPYSLLAW